MEFVGQVMGTLVMAVADADGLRTLVEQVAGSQLAHLACADNKNLCLRKVAENIDGQIDSGAGNRNTAEGNLRFGTHALADGDSAVHDGI